MQNRFWIWVGFVITALILPDALNLTLYGVVIPAAALILMPLVRRSLGQPGRVPRPRADRQDMVVMAIAYVHVVSLFRLAFSVFTPARVTGLFLSFAAALVLGVAGPVFYTVWRRRRPLTSLGIRLHNWRGTVALGLVFAAVEFSITLWGYNLPRPVDWVPLLVMALTVGAFESVFFRGFIQGRLEESFGAGPAVFGRPRCTRSITSGMEWPGESWPSYSGWVSSTLWRTVLPKTCLCSGLYLHPWDRSSVRFGPAI